VISHLHYDHSGGLPDLIEAPVYLMEEHWKAFKNGFYATSEGATPDHWPKDFAPEFLQPTGLPLGPFEKTYPITGDGKVVAVQTPGHVPGHLSVIVYADGSLTS
jgi:glyoxylase-like metal-dependent hydrolase (beta-lactamase superfamily II)